MTGPPPCCISSCYNTYPSYGNALCHGASPYYGSQYPNPCSQSDIVDKIPQEVIPQEHIPLTGKNEMQRQELVGKGMHIV